MQAESKTVDAQETKDMKLTSVDHFKTCHRKFAVNFSKI
jgi:hypothetical protein